MKLVLIGYMGSGKTSVGSILATTLGYPFKDLDMEIEKIHQISIPEIFNRKGEIFFRKEEARILKEIMSSEEDFVLATGGGTPCYGTVMDDLLQQEKTQVIYLKHNLDTLAGRLFEEKDNRPMISHLETQEILHDFIRKHLFERAYYYNRAQLIIDCESLTPEEVVQKIVLQLF